MTLYFGGSSIRDCLGRTQPYMLINESGVYSLTVMSGFPLQCPVFSRILAGGYLHLAVKKGDVISIWRSILSANLFVILPYFSELSAFYPIF